MKNNIDDQNIQSIDQIVLYVVMGMACGAI